MSIYEGKQLRYIEIGGNTGTGKFMAFSPVNDEELWEYVLIETPEGFIKSARIDHVQFIEEQEPA